MKSSMLLGFSLMCAAFLSSPTSVANDTLRGCLEVKKLTASIVKLRENNGKTISAEQLISIWPTPLEESACQSDKGCRLLVSKDRIISGHCECCEAFAFDVQQDDDGQRVERLHNVIFHYSARSKTATVDAARKIGQAAGLPERELGRINSGSPQNYEWKREEGPVQQRFAIELRITQEDGNWELYLSLGVSD
jgi:hypothetical protein